MKSKISKYINENFVDLILIGMSLVIFSFLFYLAFTISYTHDESFTFLVHRNLSLKDILLNKGPAPANNHIFNTILIKLFTALFGKSQIMGRLPSLISFGIYLTSIFLLFRRNKWYIRFFSFILLATNPFLLTYFFLSRGYGLGIGILILSIYFFLKGLETGRNCFYLLSLWVGGLSVWASFVLLTFYVPICLLVFYKKLLNLSEQQSVSNLITKIKNIGKQLITFIAPIIFWVGITFYPIYKLLHTGNLYYGGKTGFWTDTVVTLIKKSIYWDGHQELQSMIAQVGILSAVIISVLLLANILNEYNSKNESLNWSLALLLLGFSFNFTQHILLGSLFLINRTALIYIPVFFVFLINTVSSLIRQDYFWIKWMGYLIAFFFVTFSLINFSNWIYIANSDWKFNSRTKELVQKIMELENGSSQIKLATDWHVEPPISYYKNINDLEWLVVDRRGLGKDILFDYYYYSDSEQKPSIDTSKLCKIDGVFQQGYSLYRICESTNE